MSFDSYLMFVMILFFLHIKSICLSHDLLRINLEVFQFIFILSVEIIDFLQHFFVLSVILDLHIL